MNVNAIKHNVVTGCYAYDKDTLIVTLETGKEVTSVNVFAGDPFKGAFGEPWRGKKLPMTCKAELKNSVVWETVVVPEFKRLRYYFEINSGAERVFLFDDGLHANDCIVGGKALQYFTYAWLNPSDVCVVPKWAEDVVWYQIFPDRFNRSEGGKSSLKLLDWGDENNAKFHSFYGGNLRGIIDKLDYIKDLGVSGLYLTPIMRSDTNHRYNIHDYTLIDPELGTEDDLKELIAKAHDMDIKIMLDAVFNHCGREFFAWKDVLHNGKGSKYFDWFFINDTDFASKSGSTEDGRYYSFAFAAYMPKLNTNNPAVADYLINICKGWIELGIDGIRFDVGNEISHTFLKKLRIELKAIKPDIFLLGELWHRSTLWLTGDQYDSIMNFQFLNSVNDFQSDKSETAAELMYAVNEMYCNYYKQVNAVLFNMLDNHDVARAVTRCGSVDGMLQGLVMLMTMPGSPSIYYGTETGMAGEERESRNRRCMDWKGIDSGKYDELMSDFKRIVALRKYYLRFKYGNIDWHTDKGARVVDYVLSNAAGNRLEVILNSSCDNIKIDIDKNVIYSRKLDGNVLSPYGIAVLTDAPMKDTFDVNGKSYNVIKLLGKGKGGYSYLVTDGENKYVLKQIHHEPCAYYSFGDKLGAELNDYNRLNAVGIPIPKLIDVDKSKERILKEYIEGETVDRYVIGGTMREDFYSQIKQMCRQLYAAHLNIDYYPTNFVVKNGKLFYIDYECNDYSDEWNFENWGVKYWYKTAEFCKSFGSNE